MYASNRPTLGRRMLMTDEREITKDNIISVVSKAFMEHQENVAQEVFSFEYEKGNQPILNREKENQTGSQCHSRRKQCFKDCGRASGILFFQPDHFRTESKDRTDKETEESLIRIF